MTLSLFVALCKSSFISIMLSFLVLHISCCIYFFSLWHLGIMAFSMFDLTIGIVFISNDQFLNLALHRSWIVIFCKILKLFNECKHIMFHICCAY
jgi:hypothetical protein